MSWESGIMSWSKGSSKGQGFVSTAMKDAMSKAITNKEIPVKLKYIRELVLLTVTEEGASGFWNWMEGKTVLNDVGMNSQNYMMFWKFCFTLHNVFSEGNAKLIAESLSRIDFLSRLTEVWNDHKAGKRSYDTLISYYSGFLVVKLRFHKKNPSIPPNLEMSEQDFYKMLDRFHQDGKELKVFCSEVMHHWDFILVFLTTMYLIIPSDFGSDGVNQCKMQPLSICLNENNQLYKLSKSILYQLHADAADPNSMKPLRDKFNNLFIRFREYKFNTANWPRESTVEDIELPETPPTFEMVHSPNYCPINQEHFHGTLIDYSPDTTGNQNNSAAAASAPIYSTPTRSLSMPYGAGIGPKLSIPASPSTSGYSSQSTTPTTPYILNEQLLLRDFRIRELEEKNRFLTQKVELLESNAQPYENLQSEKVERMAEVERLQNELKQLKVNSAQQFLQLYSTIREKDELLAQVQVEKNQYELLAQMNLERLQVELHQSEECENSKNMDGRIQ